MDIFVGRKPEKIKIGKSEGFPYPTLPVLLYRGVLKTYARKKANQFEEHFHASGWRGVWRDTIYTYRHFHSNAHEALGIVRGSVKVELGADKGTTVRLKAGDLIVLPAGTVHRRLAGSKNLSVVGAYPKGQQAYNMCRDLDDCRKAQQKINRLALPKSDPFYGKDGPLMKIWSR